MRFSERMGIIKVSNVLQKEKVSEELMAAFANYIQGKKAKA